MLRQLHWLHVYGGPLGVDLPDGAVCWYCEAHADPYDLLAMASSRSLERQACAQPRNLR